MANHLMAIIPSHLELEFSSPPDNENFYKLTAYTKKLYLSLMIFHVWRWELKIIPRKIFNSQGYSLDLCLIRFWLMWKDKQ